MADSVYLTNPFGGGGSGTVSVAAAGALDGDGSVGDPLTVLVDGATITINGSNQLVGSAAGAPTDATYITQTANGSLSAEQALSSLSTGLMQVTTTTGVITSVTTSAGVAALLSDESGTGALIFGTAPAFTGPVTLAEAVGSSGLTITGATQTASFPALSITQTWNNAGVTFTGLKVNVTSTASAAASLLMDLQVGAASKAAFTKAGRLIAPEWSNATSGDVSILVGSGIVALYNSSNVRSFVMNGTLVGIRSDYPLGWSSTTDAQAAPDLLLYREAAAILQMGADVNGAAVAQTFKAHDGITGTDIAGANLTLAGGRGTGAGAPGNLIFSTATALSTGTTAQTLTARMTLAQATLTFADAVDVAFNATTGTKIGTATTQKLAFYNATPIVQGASVADASGGAVIDAEARTAINALISRIEATGLIATV